MRGSELIGSLLQHEEDEYTYQPQEEEDDEYEAEVDELDGSTSRRGAAATRRSTRTNGARAEDDWSEWRGERRSSRLGASADMQLDEPPPKRARTDDSAVSGNSGDAPPPPTNGKSGNGLKIKINGAAAMKPTETAVEAIAGKKKSKFWYYAIEPVPGIPAPAVEPPPTSDSAPQSEADKADPDDAMSDGPSGNGGRYPSTSPSASGANAEELYEKSIGGSLSPTSSMYES